MRPFDINSAALDGPMLVEASAGTGKTYAITAMVLRLLIDRQIELEQILVVTFTEAATAELRERVRGRLRLALDRLEHPRDTDPDDDLAQLLRRQPDPQAVAKRLRRAVRDIDDAAIFTIHGFCQRVLRDFAMDSDTPLDAELLTDQSALLDEVTHDFWSIELAAQDGQHIDIFRRLIGGPARCRDLVALATRSPDMPLLGPTLEGCPKLDTAPFRAAFAAASMAWRRDVIEQKFAAARDVLNGNKYRPSSLPSWCDAMDRYITLRPEYPRRFDQLHKFCADVLLDGCKKGKHARVPKHPFFDACQRLRDAIDSYDQAAAPIAIDFRRRLAGYAREQLPARKAARGVLSFDDLLLRLHEALIRPLGHKLAVMIRGRYAVALIDEFQDTDPVQYAIFRTIWPDEGLFLIGDPKQAIYAFRGADVFAYLAAAESIVPERAFTMTTNYRSDELLVTAVNALFTSARAPFVLPRIEFHPVRARHGAEAQLSGIAEDEAGALYIRQVSRTLTSESTKPMLSRLVAHDIARLLHAEVRLADRPLTSADVAVLTRSNAEAFAVQDALTEVGVRSVVLGDQSVLESNLPDGLSMQRVLAAVLEPTRSGLVRAALSTRVFGVTAAELASMDDDTNPEASRSWQRWVDRFRRYHQRWAERGFIQMFRSLMTDNKVAERLLQQVDGERRMTNLLHLVELLHRASVEEHLGPVGLFQWFRTVRATARDSHSRPDAMQVRLESDEQAVKLTTIHKSKGLQYPIVYCPFLCGDAVRDSSGDIQFHDPENNHALSLLLSGSDLSAVAEYVEREQMAEGVRLLYVALTRAQHRCVIYWGRHDQWTRSALGYLLHGADAFAVGGLSQMSATVKKLDDDAIWQRLGQLARACPGAIGLSRLEQLPALPDAALVQVRARRLRSLQIPKPIVRWSRTASFTELSSRSVESTATLDPHDWDARAAASSNAVADRAAPQATAPEPIAPAAAEQGQATLALFPRGARPGTCLHALLEHWDFSETCTDIAQAYARVTLTAHGFDAEQWADEVGRALIAVCHTPLRGEESPLRLADVPRDQRLDEFEFLFPVATDTREPVRSPDGSAQLTLSFAPTESADGSAAGALSTKALASVFGDYPSAALPIDYSDRVRSLLFLPLHGFLKGFVDLIFCHDDRWYVVDYKSNYLGDQLADYGAEALSVAMAEGHYYLQYHLYVVALHRYLQLRLPGYRYDRHFGGVYYLFLRGMSVATGSRYGVFFERPPSARIERLSRLLQHPTAPKKAIRR